MGKKATCRVCGRGFERSLSAGIYSYCKRCAARADREIARKPRVDCRECGKAFPTRTRAVRYCSDACRSAATRRLSAENWRKHDADPKKRALRMARTRVHVAAHLARKRGDKPPRAGRDASSLRPNARPAEPYPCALCGRDFAPYGGGGHPVHCKRCRARVDKEIGRKRTLNCKECGTRFSTPNRSVCYCSPKCRAAGRRRIARESARRRRNDPEVRAIVAARSRAWAAARRGDKKGRGGG